MLETQLALTALWGVIWFVSIKTAAKKIFEPFIKSMPWCKQWTDLNRQTFKTAFMIEYETSEEVFQAACLFLAIICQHAVGGFLCLPSMLGYTGSIVSALACHGALCEAGWEFQDVCERLYQLMFEGESGKKKNPTPLLVILCLHHTMGLSMVVPMNMYYGSNTYYHEFVFLLQGAAFIACLSQNYGYTLNCKTSSGLTQMKVCVSITLVTMLWSRLLRYSFVGFKLISTFYADDNKPMLYCGGSVLCLMSMLNILFVLDAVGKFAKFMKMTHNDSKVENAAVAANGALHRHQSRVILSTSQKEWAKVRGALYMGAFKMIKQKKA